MQGSVPAGYGMQWDGQSVLKLREIAADAEYTLSCSDGEV
jgi:hypothetical protein